MAMLGLDATSRGDEAVVSLRGELDAVSAPAALAVVAAAAIRGQSVVVDLAESDFLDCCAVGLLMQARVVAQESGNDVVLANSRGSVLRTLTVLGLAEMPAEVIGRGANGNDPSSMNARSARLLATGRGVHERAGVAALGQDVRDGAR
jgi:anti-anti-sigma factor